jgi:tetratricopeptide (TPR) repeat protein
MRAFNALGVVLVMQERYLEAEPAFRKATALDDKFGEAHLNLGNLLFREYREGEAIDELEKIPNTDPANQEAVGLLGEAYLSLQNVEGATRLLDYVDARKIPHDPLMHFRLAQQLEAHQRMEIAVEQFRTYVGEAPAAAFSEDALHEINRLTKR